MSSSVSRRQIAKVAVDLLEQGVSISKLSQQLAAYLLSQKRTSELEPLVRDIADIRAEKGIAEVTAVSARQLNDSVKAEVKKLSQQAYPQAKHFIINEEIKPEIVGGIIVSTGDIELDLSVHGRLKKLKAVEG